jgi:hypothetical protein
MKMDTLWYKDGELNICYLALDKHIQDGYGDQIAFIYDSPVTQTVKKIFLEVKTEVAKLLEGCSLGIKKKYSRNLYAYDSPSFCYACMCKNWSHTSVVLEGLPRMNWQSELTIANPDNYNRLFWN